MRRHPQAVKNHCLSDFSSKDTSPKLGGTFAGRYFFAASRAGAAAETGNLSA